MFSERARVAWGALGAAAAALFAVWLLFFPDLVPGRFAWDVHPRYAQLFIGAGYVFRTLFFINAARESNWFRLRWIVWGNLVFTGTLLFATYWHVESFHWNPVQTPFGHIWLVLYIFEPLSMLYLIPRGALSAPAPRSGGSVHPAFRSFLVLVAGVLLMDGLLLVGRPDFAATRWPWVLNDLDARIVAAWFLGWAGWTATMAFATDWDEIRMPTALAVVNSVLLLVTAIAFRGDLLDRGTATGYILGLAVLAVGMSGFFILHERRRPILMAAPVDAPTTEPAVSSG